MNSNLFFNKFATKLSHFFWQFPDSKPSVVIDVPPRYATGSLHYGHCLSYSQLDFYAKYLMLIKNKQICYPLCFDVNGTPIEIQTEKKYKISPFSTTRSKFIQKCRSVANKNILVLKKEYRKMGFSFSTNYFYRTDSSEYRQFTQSVFLELINLGAIYSGTRVNYWCPGCRTPIAKSERVAITKEIKGYYIRINSFFVIYTTRIELLFELKFFVSSIKYKSQNHSFIWSDIHKKVFPHFYCDSVNPNIGSGRIMVVGVDEIDEGYFKLFNHKFVNYLTREGKVISTNLSINQTKLLYLSKFSHYILNSLVKSKTIFCCWRCGSKIENFLEFQFFLKSVSLKTSINNSINLLNSNSNSSINFLLDWNTSLDRDWPISRNRFYATIIPCFYCYNCNLLNYPSKITKEINHNSTIFCSKCFQKINPMGLVFDTWFDSSLSSYFLQSKINSPIESVIRFQSKDILRSWAYYSLVQEQYQQKKVFDNLFLGSYLINSSGKAMHTSDGTASFFSENSFFPDLLRSYFSIVKPGETLTFQIGKIDSFRPLLVKIYNVCRFIKFNKIKNLANQEQIDCDLVNESNQIIDKLLSFYSNKQFHLILDTFAPFFFKRFCSFYLESYKKNTTNLYWFKEVFLRFMRVLFPIIPFTTDLCFRILTKLSLLSQQWELNPYLPSTNR